MIHAADLPQGKGWAPLTWQVLEGKNDIVFTLFEADASTDNGPFYLKKTLHLSGYELAPELRALQAQLCVSMCKEYLAHQDELPAQPQSGSESFYRKRTAVDSQIDLAQTLEQQFNLLTYCAQSTITTTLHSLLRMAANTSSKSITTPSTHRKMPKQSSL